MNTTAAMDEVRNEHEMPGMQLARVREKKGYSQEYVAGKLHLRVRIIELLESDSYDQMPEPVFIKGYLRAYAKLLGISHEPFLTAFNSMHTSERKVEKALWQSKRESHKGERLLRWLTGIVAVAAVVAVGIWWQKNKDSQQVVATAKNPAPEITASKAENDINLTDISKMQAMFTTSSTTGQLTPLENQGG
ncbi:helix-turn-helix domain-containing protein [Legionella jordanis]|uniref:DNA-binding protein n=1 Tax=Legionella jordanis TaxID=456 RepID=A0A0W0VAP9_9GAMM|nr:helix-turn-helix domain-containing protein [Legionella jordanis]KTD17178.1 DNA-binding protein [Legionella jordanis]RMX03299.1 helix-turn-helix domain-containing protein [Legionella jordanis]RMX18277.1 helix-turn-helix domain-containing protein [Legionella jordanis]VEH12624.1 DNA-binding protein [Legionella jordanis]HAT8713302.1 helix-turn-helix domain-containing protein [Legionella jordanis]